MGQLIMRWKNDGTAAREIVLPDGVKLKNFTEIKDAKSAWLNIVSFMGQGEAKYDGELYEKVMVSQPHYDEKLCFFLCVEEVPAATITVICDRENKAGLIHMVSCDPNFRGRGLGKLLSLIAVEVLKKEGMETARLTTDDWRIPAIKTYLRAGFTPDLEKEPDFKERWEKIYREIG